MESGARTAGSRSRGVFCGSPPRSFRLVPRVVTPAGLFPGRLTARNLGDDELYSTPPPPSPRLPARSPMSRSVEHRLPMLCRITAEVCVLWYCHALPHGLGAGRPLRGNFGSGKASQIVLLFSVALLHPGPEELAMHKMLFCFSPRGKDDIPTEPLSPSLCLLSVVLSLDSVRWAFVRVAAEPPRILYHSASTSI